MNNNNNTRLESQLSIGRSFLCSLFSKLLSVPKRDDDDAKWKSLYIWEETLDVKTRVWNAWEEERDSRWTSFETGLEEEEDQRKVLCLTIISACNCPSLSSGGNTKCVRNSLKGQAQQKIIQEVQSSLLGMFQRQETEREESKSLLWSVITYAE